MNKRYKKQKQSLLIFLLIIPLIASWATSKYMFNNISNKKTIKAVKVEERDEIRKQIDGFDIYSIQVGSVENYKEAKKIVNNLESASMPNYIHKKDSAYKIYTYVSLGEWNVRKYLKNIRGSYSDAFISKIEVGSIDLEYTKKYEYMNEICDGLNLIIENIKQESQFWNEYKMGKSNYDDYIKIMNNKSKIVDLLTKNSKKFKGKDAENFEKELSEFCRLDKKNIESVNKKLGKNDLKACEKLFLSSLFEYNKFINKIKNI